MTVKDNPVWTPSPTRVAASNMTAYLRYLQRTSGLRFEGYHDLYQWSIDKPGAFWKSISDYMRVIYSKQPTTILEGGEIMTARWFTGARLNFAENLLRFRDSRTAIIAQSESRPSDRITYNDLYRQVASCARYFRELGLQPGDRVAALVPNTAETVVAMLAATSLGAVWSSCSPDFGFQGVIDRFGQIQPRLLIGADGYRYNGNIFDSIGTMREVESSIESIEQVVVIPHDEKQAGSAPDHWLLWGDLVSTEAGEIEFEQLPFDHPVYIMYSSGTTGVPKCIVHGSGGTLLQHLKELVLHTDLKRDDTITYFTTCGWMMWNWLVSSLAVGATVYLYDGSPTYPDPGRMFESIQSEKITIFGTSPKFLSSCEKSGLSPREEYDLSSLRTVLSTGAPLTDGNFRYVYDHIKPDLQLSSISGGTDIISCFLLGNPLLSVYSGELQCPGLGMKVEAFDDRGNAVVNKTGELVCTAPFPSRPVRFWDDPDNARYRAAYFEHFPGIWRHGDFVSFNERGGAVIYGRSDATLNPGGVRIGTAEIYGPVESMEEIRDSLVIGQKIKGETRIVLFVVTAEGVTLDDRLRARIRKRLREHRTPRHIPRLIVAVEEIPRTISGKKVELAVTRIVHGQPVSNRDALANPDSLIQFENIPELRQR